MRGALNLFQATMLRWRSRHPYNAVHAARVGAPLDEARLRAAIDAVLEACGLTGYTLDARRGRYEWRGGAAEVALDVVSGSASADALRAAIERALDHPYPREGAYCPFRFDAIACTMYCVEKIAPTVPTIHANIVFAPTAPSHVKYVSGSDARIAS